MFDTKRLTFRKFERGDVNVIHAMRSDPEIMRFIGDLSEDPADSEKWMTKICAPWNKEGIGYLAIVEKATGQLSGWCGLWVVPETQEIEVGYAIAKSKWGRGYATEAAAAFVEYAFRELELARIVALAFPENAASINVMKKLGMRYVRTGQFYGKRLVQYALNNRSQEGNEAE